MGACQPHVFWRSSPAKSAFVPFEEELEGIPGLFKNNLQKYWFFNSFTHADAIFQSFDAIFHFQEAELAQIEKALEMLAKSSIDIDLHC